MLEKNKNQRKLLIDSSKFMNDKTTHLGFDFFILFPGGYRVRDIKNDNTDINVVLKSNYSFFYCTTVFTLENIRTIMENNNEKWFWSNNFLITKDLSRESIYQSVDEILKSELLEIDNVFIKVEETDFDNEIREYLL